MSDVTQILSKIEQGDTQAADQLLPLVYEELRKLATIKLANEKPGQTLQATALVHDAYIRLVDRSEAQHWNSRGHFFAAAAEAMRRILIDQARKKARLKRGGGFRRLDLDRLDLVSKSTHEELLSIDEAISKLRLEDPASADVIKLRYFAGLSLEKTAQALGISTTSAYRQWNFARAWLHNELIGSGG